MKRGRLTERETSLIVRDIANGLNFLHSKGMSHRSVKHERRMKGFSNRSLCLSRDLKPENILVERADSLIPIKLCDFDLGSAIRLNSNKTTPISTPELSTPVSLSPTTGMVMIIVCYLGRFSGVYGSGSRGRMDKFRRFITNVR